MHFDRLDEIYVMVKSILSFEQLDKTGLTGFRDRSDRSCTAVPILVVNKYLPDERRIMRVATYNYLIQMISPPL